MQTIKKIAEKYNDTMQDLRNFKRDKRSRKQNDIEEDTTYLQTERKNFSAQIENILERTKMDKLKNIVKGKEYEHKSLLVLSSLFSTLGILIHNNWITCSNGLHKNFKWLSFTTIVCLIVAYIFFKIMDKAYKHFFNIPFLFNNFDKYNKKDKIIDIVSLIICIGLFIFSMITNTIAFKSLGANMSTSFFLGIGIDLINIICVWFKNKFTSLDGYNLQKNNEKNNEKNASFEYIQNCMDKAKYSNLGLDFFSKKNDEKLDKNLDKKTYEKIEKKEQKKTDKKYNKAGRKMDKKTRERIINEIEKLEKDKPITRKNVNYKGDDKMLKRLCNELIEQDKLINSKTDKNNRVRFYRK